MHIDTNGPMEAIIFRNIWIILLLCMIIKIITENKKVI